MARSSAEPSTICSNRRIPRSKPISREHACRRRSRNGTDMEKNANYFIVGLFVSLALLALVGFTIWLMGAGDFSQKQRYTIYFTDTVSGLVNEAVVKYQGVNVGRI